MEKISRTKIVDLLKREDFGAMVNVKGCLYCINHYVHVAFLSLSYSVYLSL